MSWAAALALTLAVDFTAFALARSLPAPRGAAMTLLVGLLWVLVATPVFAAGGNGPLESLLRGALVPDASLVVLLALAAASPALTLTGALKAYLLWSALAVAQCLLVALSADSARRYVLAVVVSAAAVAVAAGPFWTNALVLAGQASGQRWVTDAVVAVNPAYATLGCLDRGFELVWNERPILYEHSVLGRDAPLTVVSWHVTVLLYAALAALAALAGAAAWRRRKRAETGA
jgi:hypothetical protein